MIAYDDALKILTQNEKMDTTSLDTQDACGYVLAEPIVSHVNVPPFDNSAMDGFAVCPEDLAAASPENPVSLPVRGCSFAGDLPGKNTAAGDSAGAWEIMTGAAIPEGYTAVVKIEDVNVENDSVHFTAPVKKQNNIRLSGEDITSGDLLAKENTLITPYHVMAMATVGQRKVRVYKKPKFTIFNTGKELVEDSEATLQPGQIRNSNGPFLFSTLRDDGYTVEPGGTILDDAADFENKIRETLATTDIFISTGAVSAGKHDFIPDSLKKLGADILFHKVAVRPGKPILYARFKSGQHYFGLPGNPVSAATGLRFFVMPLLRHIQSLPPENPLETILHQDTRKKVGLRFFMKAHISLVDHGTPRLSILPGQQSFKIKPMLAANCWAVLDEEHDGTKAGGNIQVYPLIIADSIVGESL